MLRRAVLGVLIVLAGLAALPGGRLSAQSTPASFALTAADFPSGSQIVESEVASNEDITLRHLQIGPAPPPGRVSGYYMQARILDATGRIHLVISYLVSLYDTAASAQQAFAQQTDFWQGLVRSGAVERPLGTDAPGEPGAVHWYALSTAAADTHSELYFRRGAVFVQLDLDSFGGGPTVPETNAFLAMARTLDNLAGHPATVTPVPTATATPLPTATRTPLPTPTLTPAPSPTPKPTLAPVRPVKEPKTCKKGYRKVNGKCQKSKKI